MIRQPRRSARITRLSWGHLGIEGAPGDIVHDLYICLDTFAQAQDRSLCAAVSTQKIKSE